MAASTTLIVTFNGTYVNGLPTATSTVTLPIRASSDFNNAVHNLFLYGGFWYVNASGVEQFVPWNVIVGITAQ
jgi:hypothetical protein